MREIRCKHCGNLVAINDAHCQRCGIPLPPNHGSSSQKNFVLMFAGLSIFCIVMMLWLPPDWLRFMGR